MVWLFKIPPDYSLPDSSVHGILQARMLEWVAISFSRGSSQPRDWTNLTPGEWILSWEIQQAHVLLCFAQTLIHSPLSLEATGSQPAEKLKKKSV